MLRRNAALAAGLGAGLLAGCGGAGGDGGYCVGSFQGGSTSFSCTTCNGPDVFEENPFAAAIDNKASTNRFFGFSTGGGTITISIRAPSGMSYPAGANAGALIRFPAGVPVTASYNLYYLGAAVPSTSGATIATAGSPNGAGSATYYPVKPGATIDRIDLSVSSSAAAEFQLHEMCGDR